MGAGREPRCCAPRQAACADGRVCVVERREVRALRRDGGAWRLQTAPVRAPPGPVPALPPGAAYFTPRAAAALPSEAAAGPAGDEARAPAAAAASPVMRCSPEAGGSAACCGGAGAADAAAVSAPAPRPGPEPIKPCSAAPDAEGCLRADVIWLATGGAYDAAADPVLAALQRCAGTATRLLGGYPELARGAPPGPGLTAAAPLPPPAWPGLPLFLLGRGALLAVGPGAGAAPSAHVRRAVSSHRSWAW